MTDFIPGWPDESEPAQAAIGYWQSLLDRFNDIFRREAEASGDESPLTLSTRP